MSKLKSKIIELIATQLCNYIKEKFPYSVTDARTLQDTHDWHNYVDGAVRDKVAWRIMRVPFDDKSFGMKLIKRMKANYGVNYEDESNRGFSKNYSISLNVKARRKLVCRGKKPWKDS